jgi:hypothetical protein
MKSAEEKKAGNSPEKAAPTCFVLPCVTNTDFNGFINSK